MSFYGHIVQYLLLYVILSNTNVPYAGRCRHVDVLLPCPPSATTTRNSAHRDVLQAPPGPRCGFVVERHIAWHVEGEVRECVPVKVVKHIATNTMYTTKMTRL